MLSLSLCRMRLLVVTAAFLAVASAASLSLEDMEFHAWKMKFGKRESSSLVLLKWERD